MQLSQHYGALDVSFLEAALVRNAQGSALDSHTDDALARCRELASAADDHPHRSVAVAWPKAHAEHTFGGIAAPRRQTMSSVQWRACPSVCGSDGLHSELMSYVEAILDATSLSYIIPYDLAHQLHEWS